MTRKQTSAKVSSMAARYMAASDAEILEMMFERRNTLLSHIRTLAASCLSQDEIKGDSPAQRRKKAQARLTPADELGLSDVDIISLMHGKPVFKTGKPIGKNTAPTMKMPRRKP